MEFMCLGKFFIFSYISSHIYAFGLWNDDVGHLVSKHLIQHISKSIPNYHFSRWYR